jgi:Lon protease-like protein
MELPIFPLNTVLFPGGRLPLKIFEQRYLDMTRDCLRDNQPFAVFLIREGAEVGAPATCQEVGCIASITDWEMPQLGIFHLLTEGGDKARIVRQWTEANGLVRGEVELLPVEMSAPLAPEFQRCVEILELIIEKTGEEFFPYPQRYEDALWVGYRLAEVLPMELSARQELLELSDPEERMRIVRELMRRQGFVV